jgi:hypothetical protein
MWLNAAVTSQWSCQAKGTAKRCVLHVRVDAEHAGGTSGAVSMCQDIKELA